MGVADLTGIKWFDGYTESINALAAGQLDANCQTSLYPWMSVAQTVLLYQPDNASLSGYSRKSPQDLHSRVVTFGSKCNG